MLLVLPSGFTLFIPLLFPSKEVIEDWPSFRILYATELCFIMIALPGVVLLVRALGCSARLFHMNLIRIMQAHLIAFAVSQVSRLMAVLYETRVIRRSEDSFDILVFTTMTARFASLCSTVTIIPAMVTERVFASRFVSDYEKIPRPWIPTLISGVALVLAISYYTLSMLACLSAFFILGLSISSVIIMTLSSAAILMVYRTDVALLKDLANKTGASTVTYTLSLKFQLEENVRVTKLLMHLSVGSSVWGCFGCCLFVSAFVLFDGTNPFAQLLFYVLFNNYIALSFTILVWILLWSTGELRRVLGMCFTSRHCLLIIGEERPSIFSKGTPSLIDDHFNQLKSAWAV